MPQDLPFIRKSTRAKYSPQDGSEPLTVIEFSLMPRVKDELEKSLEPFVEGRKNEKNNAEELKRIIKRNLPKEVLDYFREVKKQDSKKVLPNVYVMRNLPEVPETQIDQMLGVQYINTDKEKKWAASKLNPEKTYAGWIGKGLALAIDCQHDCVNLVRSANLVVEGTDHHKHDELITGLSPVKSLHGTITKTRVTDWVSMLNQPTNLILYNPSDEFYTSHELHQLGITEEDIANNSQDIALASGEAAFWCNKGKVSHCALPTEFLDPNIRKNRIVRALFSHIIGEADKELADKSI